MTSRSRPSSRIPDLHPTASWTSRRDQKEMVQSCLDKRVAGPSRRINALGVGAIPRIPLLSFAPHAPHAGVGRSRSRHGQEPGHQTACSGRPELETISGLAEWKADGPRARPGAKKPAVESAQDACGDLLPTVVVQPRWITFSTFPPGSLPTIERSACEALPARTGASSRPSKWSV